MDLRRVAALGLVAAAFANAYAGLLSAGEILSAIQVALRSLGFFVAAFGCAASDREEGRVVLAVGLLGAGLPAIVVLASDGLGGGLFGAASLAWIGGHLALAAGALRWAWSERGDLASVLLAKAGAASVAVSSVLWTVLAFRFGFVEWVPVNALVFTGLGAFAVALPLPRPLALLRRKPASPA